MLQGVRNLVWTVAIPPLQGNEEARASQVARNLGSTKKGRIFHKQKTAEKNLPEQALLKIKQLRVQQNPKLKSNLQVMRGLAAVAQVPSKQSPVRTAMSLFARHHTWKLARPLSDIFAEAKTTPSAPSVRRIVRNLSYQTLGSIARIPEIESPVQT